MGFFAFMAVAVVFGLFVLVLALRDGDTTVVLGLGLFFLLLATCFWPGRIEIGEGEVRVRTGLMISRRLPLSEIRRVRPGRSFGGYSYWFEDGLRIEGPKLTIGAVVRDPAALRAGILAAAPHLRAYGDELRGEP